MCVGAGDGKTLHTALDLRDLPQMSVHSLHTCPELSTGQPEEGHNFVVVVLSVLKAGRISAKKGNIRVPTVEPAASH